MDVCTSTQEDEITDDVITTTNNQRVHDVRGGYSLTSGEDGQLMTTLSSRQHCDDALTSSEDMATRNEHSWTYVKNELRKIRKDDRNLHLSSIQQLNKAPSISTSMMNTATSLDEQRSVTSLAQILERDILEVLNDMKDVANRHHNLAKLEDLVLTNLPETPALRQQEYRQMDFDQAQIEVTEMLAEIRAIRNGQLPAAEGGARKKERQHRQRLAAGTSKKAHAVISASRGFMLRSNQIELELPTFLAEASSCDLLVADPRVNERELEECMRKGEDLVYGSPSEDKKPKSKPKNFTNRTAAWNVARPTWKY